MSDDDLRCDGMYYAVERAYKDLLIRMDLEHARALERFLFEYSDRRSKRVAEMDRMLELQLESKGVTE